MFATVLIPVMLLAPSGSQGQEPQVLRQFAQAVQHYAWLHQTALESVPRQLCGGPEEIDLTRSLLEGEIRRLRPNAREGEIFTREAGAWVRRHLEAAIRDARWFAPDPEIGPGGRPIRHVAEVNAAYPPYFADQPWAAFRALPPLPDALEYRLVGQDLVLVDVIANLVVDVLRGAIRTEE